MYIYFFHRRAVSGQCQLNQSNPLTLYQIAIIEHFFIETRSQYTRTWKSIPFDSRYFADGCGKTAGNIHRRQMNSSTHETSPSSYSESGMNCVLTQVQVNK